MGIFKIVPAFKVANLSKVKILFDISKEALNVSYDFDFLIKNTHLYLLFKNENFTGGIYYFNDVGLEKFVREYFSLSKGGGGQLLFMNGFSLRKVFDGNLFAIRETAKYYSSDIFSVTDKKPACLCLSVAGFKQIPKKNVPVKEQNFKLFRLENEREKLWV